MVAVGLHQGGKEVAKWLASTDVDDLNAELVRAAFVDLANIERAHAALRARLIERAIATNAHKDLGLTNITQLVAKYCGTTSFEAGNIVKTAEAMRALPDLASAVESGDISEREATAIRRSGVGSPAAVNEMIAKAKVSTVKELDEQAAAMTRGSSIEEERERRVQMRKQRRASQVERHGMSNLHITLMNEEGAQFKTVFERYRNRVLKLDSKLEFNQADADAFMLIVADTWRASNGELIAPNRVDSDVLITLLRERGELPTVGEKQRKKKHKLPPPIAAMSILVDYAPLVRGFLLPGDKCEIPGVGPVNLEYVLEVLDHSSLQFIVANGKDIKTVTSFSRSVSKHIKSALKARDKKCSVPGCDNNRYLQLDHSMPFAEGNAMTVDNGATLCTAHHRMKTNNGWRLVDDNGKPEWCSPRRVTELNTQGRLRGDPNQFGNKLLPLTDQNVEAVGQPDEHRKAS